MLINIAERAHAEVERIFRVILPESGLTVREEQIALCHSMLDSLLHNTISLCDAGVGIGKTYAYLVACILARKYSIQLSRPLVISTSSVALQEAILGEYLPFLSKVLLSNSVIDEPLTAYLRKGKERFVCDERLSQRLKAVAGTKKNAKQLAALRSLMLRYDLDTVTGLSEFDRRQVCVPKACPKSCARKDTCRYHVYLHQAQSGPAMIQICNHNYLLADAEHRRQGFHPLLKGYGILVVDEAHKLWDAACQNLVICQLSTNDASTNKPLGEIAEGTSGFDTKTITGAMEEIIAYSKATWDCPVFFYTGSYYDSENYAAMVERLFEVADKWGISVLDLWHDEEFNSISEEQRALYMKDDIHPTKAGYRDWWCPELEKQLFEFLQECSCAIK